MIDFEGTMQGPISEDNTSKLDVDWNGAIAFLDRDGVLNYGSPNYINSPEELEIIPGAKEAIEDLRAIEQNCNNNESICNHARIVGRNDTCNSRNCRK